MTNKRRIETDCIYPPIPTRQFDWVAWYGDIGGEEGPNGYGPTEEEAIKDLEENYE